MSFIRTTFESKRFLPATRRSFTVSAGGWLYQTSSSNLTAMTRHCSSMVTSQRCSRSPAPTSIIMPPSLPIPMSRATLWYRICRWCATPLVGGGYWGGWAGLTSTRRRGSWLTAPAAVASGSWPRLTGTPRNLLMSWLKYFNYDNFIFLTYKM